jgi:hypothetical protein
MIVCVYEMDYLINMYYYAKMDIMVDTVPFVYLTWLRGMYACYHCRLTLVATEVLF